MRNRAWIDFLFISFYPGEVDSQNYWDADGNDLVVSTQGKTRLPRLTNQIAIRVRSEIPTCKILLFSGHIDASQLIDKARASGHHFN